MPGSGALDMLKELLVIRTTALLSLFVVPLLAVAAPAGVQAHSVIPASAQALLRFDTPGHQAAEVTQVALRCHYYHHHRVCHHY